MDHCQYLEQQFLNEKTADIIFITNGGKKVAAHKVILAANSNEFEKQFNEIVDLKKIEITSVSSAAFREFLYACYSKHPEKKYTIENIVSVLRLAREFGVNFCTRTCEQFLVQNLSDSQLCFGYCVAIDFQLSNLKAHCQLRINSKKADTLASHSFFACDSHVFYDLLSNITIRHSNEIPLVWDACLFWVQTQFDIPSVDTFNIGKHLELLSKHFGGMVSENEDFNSFAKKHYEHLYTTTSNASIVSQPQTQTKIENAHQLTIVRLSETMLATQICSTNDTVKIELNSTKKIVLSGIAFSTVTGSPRGKLSIGICREDGESLLFVQNFNLKPTSYEPRNFVAIDGGVLVKPNQIYTICVDLHQDAVYYRSYSIKNHFNQNDLNISFKCSRPDIFSHFCFKI